VAHTQSKTDGETNRQTDRQRAPVDVRAFLDVGIRVQEPWIPDESWPGMSCQSH